MILGYLLAQYDLYTRWLIFGRNYPSVKYVAFAVLFVLLIVITQKVTGAIAPGKEIEEEES